MAYLWLEFCRGDWVGRAMIVPENSAPAVKGKGGWCWYFPWIWRRSKKLAAAAWMRIVYWSGFGVGEGMFVETWRPEESCYGVRYMQWAVVQVDFDSSTIPLRARKAGWLS